jgi:gliding motility-associated lipoprotein GldH
LKRSGNICLYILAACCIQLAIVSCTTIDLYEKSALVPGHAWKSSYKPSFTFTIKDTSSLYQLLLVLRHDDKYNYNNIWLNISVKSPGTDTVITFRAVKQLASDEKGWLASGMDDIYEHRISLLKELVENNVSFRKYGDYTFTIEQIMREDPLQHVLNVGLRLEKKQ